MVESHSHEVEKVNFFLGPGASLLETTFVLVSGTHRLSLGNNRDNFDLTRH